MFTTEATERDYGEEGEPEEGGGEDDEGGDEGHVLEEEAHEAALTAINDMQEELDKVRMLPR